MKEHGNIFFAGQITGVEGYVESAATGLIAGVNAGRAARRQNLLEFPAQTAHGALGNYITQADPQYFQPMNVNFGLLPPLPGKIKDKRLKNSRLAERALQELEKFKEKYDNGLA